MTQARATMAASVAARAASAVAVVESKPSEKTPRSGPPHSPFSTCESGERGSAREHLFEQPS